MKKKIITGITMGEPAGISTEITLKTWKNYRRKIDPFIFFGDPDHLIKTSLKLKLQIPIKIIKNISESVNSFKNYLPVYKIKLSQKVNFGSPSIKNTSKVLTSIDKVVNLAYKRSSYDNISIINHIDKIFKRDLERPQIAKPSMHERNGRTANRARTFRRAAKLVLSFRLI